MYYTVNGARYWYEIHGKGYPLIMLHGFTGSSATWSNFIKNWQEGLQIITVDLPGHGKTRTRYPKTMEECCEDLKDLFDYLGLDEFHLLGYSMGGRTALSFAMIYPKMISSLILESASPGLATEEERKKRTLKDEALAKKLEEEGIEAFVDFWENIPLFQSQKNLPKEVQQEIRHERLSQKVRGLAQSLRYMGTGSQPSWWDRLDQFEKPILLFAGEYDDKFISINKLIEGHLQGDLQDGGLIVCENSGHAIHVEQPEFFGRMVQTCVFGAELYKRIRKEEE
ncbi:2-succinyl-6-hydroxy-2,4-cyclohexadiene-1-carboxylate synthase [Virgibacillus indicus]|uniref:Putative 2-succinyl-6-hydroxy-2,4-cyclohexadiene-1-carboxylate synthase n=1 Tax=Virgibacillus indicus TaxID=2024554 RepID=A0A265N9P7_9BACI|nr:2-succinyl-6-hydroxy-2,4-cyclohexadiene-1-carboxylate synthase [Virgibacillus indicus]OZU88541.1 2-succinyl-6-hydroxy-2,4-cyclohexadiene-1-carboxylate synthase [Virgibacillus indicus]